MFKEVQMEDQIIKLEAALSESTDRYRAQVEKNDENSETTCKEICQLADTLTKIDNMQQQKELEKKKLNLEKAKTWGTIIVGIVTGIVLKVWSQKDDQNFRRNMSRESWTEAKDGIITSPTGKYWSQESVKNSKS